MPDTLRTLTDEERSALALLDDGADIEVAMEATRLTRRQIVEANNLRAVRRKIDGAVAVQPEPAKEARAGKRTPRVPSYSAQVRQWARENGHEVGGHGRMPNSVVEAFRAAHAPGA